MSQTKTVVINSSRQFESLLESSRIVVTDCELFYPSYPAGLTNCPLCLLKEIYNALLSIANLENEKSTQYGAVLARS